MNPSIINAMNTMGSLQRRLDIVGENMANMDTVGYKQRTTSFEDLLYNAKQQSEKLQLDGRLSPQNFNQGWGAKLANTGLSFTQGAFKETGVPSDLAIEGNALFEVLADGERAYTRAGTFKLSPTNAGGSLLTTAEGYPLAAVQVNPAGNVVRGANGAVVETQIVVPVGTRMHIDANGTVYAQKANGEATPLGRLRMREIVRADGLTPVNNHLFVVANAAETEQIVRSIGTELDADGNEIGIGAYNVAIRQGFLEQSNVDIAASMVDVLQMQRAYQLAARALSSGDAMMGIANAIRS